MSSEPPLPSAAGPTRLAGAPGFNLGQRMTGGGGNKRDPHDFYPTPEMGTVAFVIAEKRRLRQFAGIWEPACGDGAMAKVLNSLDGPRIYASELRRDGGYGLGGMDFLDMEVPTMADCIVTNPPFRNAEAFIRCALENRGARYLAMLLKSTYFNTARGARLWAQHPPTREWKLTWRLDFKGLGAPTMDCCWFVWDRDADPARGCEVGLLTPTGPVWPSAPAALPLFDDVA